METDFWHEKWEKGETGFHENEANPLLVAHYEKMNLTKGSRVFIPLCGKTRDCSWFLNRGISVVGAELSEIAVNALFDELGVDPEISSAGPLRRHHAEGIDIFVGDLFDLDQTLLGPVDAVYDRAALVALPEAMRVRYVSCLMDISNTAPQLLISLQYDQALKDGPPFSISAEEVRGHYAASYHLERVEARDVPGGLKGNVACTETAWYLGEKRNGC